VAPDPVYEGEMALYRFEDGAPDKVLVIRDMPWMEADFATLNSYYATYPNSPFLNKRLLYRCTPDGWISLIQNTVTRMTNGVRQTVELQTEDQVQSLMEQEFDLFVKRL
jgi:arylamine N-acetyltransferase